MRNSRSIAVSMLVGTLSATGLLWAQEAAPEGLIRHDGYSEIRLFSGSTTIQTRNGPKRIRISLGKLQIDSGGGTAKIELPAKGLAVFQHRAGDLITLVGDARYETLEGQWITIDLPGDLTFATDDDSAIVDAIVIADEQ